MFNRIWNRGILAALTLVLAICLVSAGLAGAVNASLAQTENGRQARRAAATQAERVAADFQLARRECRQLAVTERGACMQEARRAQQRSAATVHADLDCRIHAGNPSEAMAPRPASAGGLDVALYQAHRQWPP